MLQAFARCELLVIIATLVVLALLCLPARALNRGSGRNLNCLNNLRQLMLGWRMYAQDNQGKLVPNTTISQQPGWVGGILDFIGPEATDASILVNPRFSLLGPYTKNPAIYRCPHDLSAVRRAGKLLPRVRSYSMSNAMGPPGPDFGLPSPPYRTFHNLSDIVGPPLSSAWVLIEEHPDSINDGYFAVQMVEKTTLSRAHIIDYPAAYHPGGAVALAYADSHGEIHRWLDSRTKPVLRLGLPLVLNVASPGNVDMRWLSERTSSRMK